MSDLELGHRPFDADNHYYEAPDAFTRHVPKAMQPRCVQWAEINGRQHHIVGGKLAHAVVNPTWNPIAKPGAIAEYLRGNPKMLDPKTLLQEREPLPDYYMNNEARCAKLDEQGLEPLDYLAEISKFDDAKKLRILRDNVRELNELRPA